MNRPIDFTGMVFGYMTVIKLAPSVKGQRMWVCRCVCGKETVTQRGNLKRTVSCGCKNTNRTYLRQSHKRAHTSWISMLTRGNNANRESAKYYIGRGIGVCDAWQESFAHFLADMGDPPEGFSLDRIDTSQGYSKSNCRWASDVEQARNRTSTNWFRYKGDILTTTELSRVCEVPRASILRAVKFKTLEHKVPGAELVGKGTKQSKSSSASDPRCTGCKHMKGA